MVIEIPTNPPCQIDLDDVPDAIYRKALEIGLAKVIEGGTIQVKTIKLVKLILTEKEDQSKQSRKG